MADALPFGVGGPAEPAVQPPPLVGDVLKGILNIPKNLADFASTTARPPDDPNDPVAFHVSSIKGPMGDIKQSNIDTGINVGLGAGPGIFGGKLAKTADIPALIEANNMRNKGAGMSKIWNDTGWFKSPTDQKWKFEIPDTKASMNAHGINYDMDGDMRAAPTGHMFDHPELFKAYPQLQDSFMYNTVYQNPKNGTGRGLYNPEGHELPSGGTVPSLEIEAPHLSNATNIGLHELQHGVQRIENFAPGGTPSYMAKLQEQTPEKLPLHEQRSDPADIYKRLAGEVESGNVQIRQLVDKMYGPEAVRKLTPWNSQSHPYNEQLVFDPRYNMVKSLRGFK